MLHSCACGRAGLRLAPEQEDLRRFVEAVGSLDGLKVAELLRDKMVRRALLRGRAGATLQAALLPCT